MPSLFNLFSETAPLTSENESCFPKLTYKERLIGFAMCCGLGWFISLMSFGSLLSLATGSPEKFAISYSFGNFLTLLGTSFLIGFEKQFKQMKDKERLGSSIIFSVSLLLTLISALVIKSAILVLIFLMIQFMSYIWYVASYIPFARGCIKSCLGKVKKAVFKKEQSAGINASSDSNIQESLNSFPTKQEP